MSATEVVTSGQALPRIRSVSFHSGYEVAVTWDAATRDGRTDVVDLAPLIFRMRFYAPFAGRPSTPGHGARDRRRYRHRLGRRRGRHGGDLRPRSCRTVDDGGRCLGIHEAAWLHLRPRRRRTRHQQRLAGYYAAGRIVPRSIAMACELMDLQIRGESPAPASSPQVIPPPPPRTAGRSAATRAR